MSYSLLIQLLMICELIHYSYEFDATNSFLSRSIRHASSMNKTAEILEEIVDDQDEFQKKMNNFIKTMQDEINEVIDSINAAADEMTKAGSTDTKSIRHWTSIQNQLRRGINLIIKSYQEFIKAHREVDRAIEAFVRNMIEKYEDELKSIESMSLSRTPDIDSDSMTETTQWKTFVARFLKLLDYARVHQATLRTAATCTGDLIQRTVVHRSAIFSQPRTITQPMQVRIVQPTSLQYEGHTLSLPCQGVSERSGYRTCSTAIADATSRYANLVLKV